MRRLVQIAEIIIIAILCGVLIFSISGCDSKSNPGDSGDGSKDPHKASLLANGDFEQSEKGMPKFWDTASWRTNGIKFSYLPMGGRDGSAGVEILAVSPNTNDASWYQNVDDLDPEHLYNLYGYIKGENIAGNVGANLCDYGTWAHSEKENSTGTFDWKLFVVTIEADENGTVTPAARLGFWVSEASGTATFDDLYLLDEFQSFESVHLHFQFENSDLDNISNANLTKWLNNLDEAYSTYEELVGGVPFDGATIRVNSVKQYPGGWAVAGNPIKWQQRYVGSELSKVNDNGDWSFGILHEIGHNFGLDNRWMFAGEMLANLKMFYVVQSLNATVSPRSVNSEYYVGDDLRNYYKPFFEDGINNGNYNWAGVLYRLILKSDPEH